MSDVVNPYIAGNPVTGSEMFFGREDVFQFIRQTLIGQHRDNVIVLYGQRRTGKTSVLYQMRSHVDARYLCIFMDMHGFALEGLGGFLWDLANHILRILRRDYQIQLPPLNRAEFMADPRSFFENEFLNQVRSSIGGRHILLMLDEIVYLQEQVQASKLEPEIFEYMRHLMQHYEWLNFLFSLGSGLEEMEKEYAFLDHHAASDLITQPVKGYYQVEPAALERIYHITSGQPYYTQLLCHCLFNGWQRQHMLSIKIRDVDEVLDEAVERGSAVLKYDWEELTTGEKVIVAGMVVAMGKPHRPRCHCRSGDVCLHGRSPAVVGTEIPAHCMGERGDRYLSFRKARTITRSFSTGAESSPCEAPYHWRMSTFARRWRRTFLLHQLLPP